MTSRSPQSGQSPGDEPLNPAAYQTQQAHNRTVVPEQTEDCEDRVSQQLDGWSADPGVTSCSVPGNQSMRATHQQSNNTMQPEQTLCNNVQLNRTMKATQRLPSMSQNPEQTQSDAHMNQNRTGTQRMPSMTLNPEHSTRDIPQNYSMKTTQQLPGQSSDTGQTSTRGLQNQSMRGTQQLPTQTLKPELTPFKTPQYHLNKISQHLPTRTVKFDTSTFNSTGDTEFSSDPFDSDPPEAANTKDSQQARFDQLCQLAEGLLHAPQQQAKSAAPMDASMPDASQQAAPQDEPQCGSREADPAYSHRYAPCCHFAMYIHVT